MPTHTFNPLNTDALHDEPLLRLLREDAPHGDLTTHLLGIGHEAARARFSARGPMVVCGLAHAARLFELCGARAQVMARDGDVVAPQGTLLDVHGPAAALLLAWKTAQTLVEALSGIATGTHRIVQALRAEGFATPVACTRKNFPGTRTFAAQAVRAGGAVMHRLGLSETLLVFPEHRAFIDEADWPARLAALRAAQPEKRLVVEVGDEDSAVLLAQHGVDVLQLERFTPAALAALRRRLQALGLGAQLAPAGGVTAANAVDYARAGADLLVTSAPYFAPPTDVQVRIGPA